MTVLSTKWPVLFTVMARTIDYVLPASRCAERARPLDKAMVMKGSAAPASANLERAPRTDAKPGFRS